MGRRTGFTVMEAIAAIVILGVAMPPMLWGVSRAQSHRVTATMSSRARWLACEKLEDIIADRHSSTRGYTYLIAANYPAEASIAGSPGFTRSVAITETGVDLVTAGTGYKKVTCAVGFQDGMGVQRSVVLSTILTDYTP